MATTYTWNALPTFDAAFEQARDFNDQVLAAARRAGHAYLDSYEKTVDRAIKLERELADLSQQEWMKSLIDTRTQIARDVASSYTTTVRTLLK